MPAWDFTDGAVYSGLSFSVAAQEPSPNGMGMSDDGEHLYVIGANQVVYQYDLATAWDISTAVFVGSFSVAALDAPKGVFVGDGGTKMYVTDTSGGGYAVLQQYDLGTPYDVTSAVFASKLLDASTTNVMYGGIFVRADGTKVWMTGGAAFSHTIEHNLSVAWDASTYDAGSVRTLGEDLSAFTGGIVLSPTGEKMFLIADGPTVGDVVMQFTLTTPWSHASEVYDLVPFSVAAQDTSPLGLAFSDDGAHFYVLGAATDTVYQYDLLNVVVPSAGWLLGQVTIV